jgi:hypothetical protein
MTLLHKFRPHRTAPGQRPQTLPDDSSGNAGKLYQSQYLSDNPFADSTRKTDRSLLANHRRFAVDRYFAGFSHIRPVNK